jgi:mannose-6-phosphate isomerase-like protein (cupin superfamily)
MEREMRIIKQDPMINPATVKDGRGGIFTFFPVTDAVQEWSYIVTLKGSQRGHHYHKEFDEHIMFVEGSGVYLELCEDGTELTMPVASGDCIFLPRLVPHTFIPMSDCKMVAMITKRWDDCVEPITRAGQ